MRKRSAATELPPPLELECLKVLWRLGQANVAAVREHLQYDRDLAYTTVMTVLERLVRRNCVVRQKLGRSFVYSALLGCEAVRQLAVQDLVDTFFDGSEDALRSYLGQQNGGLAAVAAAAGAGVEAIPDNGGEPRLEAALL